MKSRIYEGRIRHRRFHPIEHSFTYSMYMMYLDLAELPQVFDDHPLWSARRPAPARFRREDYLGDPGVPLDTAVRDLVESRTGHRPDGPIRLLTHLRTFGYLINPVSFYYCFDAADRDLAAVVAEVTNTPWKERHAYVLDGRGLLGRAGPKRFCSDKDFHVSPFMGMEQAYEFSFVVPGPTLAVHMENHEDGTRLFDATMVLRERPLTHFELTRALLRHPFLTLRVALGIYWQALRLKLKRCPFHPHPRNRLAESRPC